MAITVEKISIALPQEMAALVRQAVDTGEYASSSEVIREALRAWQHERALRQCAFDELRTAIQEGINSGTVENFDIESTIEKAKARKQAKTRG